MKIIELLSEAISSVVYHYTNLDAAAKILTTQQFALSSTLGSIEEKFAPKGYPYFLSTTRTRRGGYHSNGVGDGAAMFNLDGNYYNQRYKGGPIDYWGDKHSGYDRAAEAEDRIFSKEPTIPSGGVTSVHIYVKPMDAVEREKYGTSYSARARTALLAAKKAGIPAYLYEDRVGWVNQDPKARIAITGSRETLRGQLPMYNPSRPPRQYMGKWLELINKTNSASLSKETAKDVYTIVHNDPYWLKDTIASLENDLGNARKPSAGTDREVAVKIITFMNRNRLQTVTDFIMALRDKWAAIEQKEKAAVAPKATELAEQSLNEKVNQSVMQSGFNDTQLILGGKFKLLAKSDGTRLTVTLHEPEADFWEDPAAYAIFDIKGFFFLKNLQSYKTWVEPEFRRMGLATAIYQYVAGLGNTIKPADVRTGMGKAMWKGFNKKGSLAESTNPKSATGNTKIYLDMDGVLADFFAEYAVLSGLPVGSSYRDIPPAKADSTLDKMIGTDFFYRLPKFPTADRLVRLVLGYVDSYSICTSPLRGDHANSGNWKREWIKKNLNPQPGEIIITGMKARHAVNADGSPNILIDDKGSNIVSWEARGGIGIKYQADEDNLTVVAQGLVNAYGK
jgi:hypothetical protein